MKTEQCLYSIKLPCEAANKAQEKNTPFCIYDFQVPNKTVVIYQQSEVDEIT